MLRTVIAVAGALIAIAFTALALTATYQNARLHIPTPYFAHGLAILLPGLTYLVMAFPTHVNKIMLHLGIPQSALPILLSILDTVLLTLASSELRPEYMKCSLSNRWQYLFSTKDAEGIRAIQDALQCCGLWSNVDRAWPFPDETHKANACLLAFGHNQSCGGLWTARSRFILSVWIAISACGLLIKALLACLTGKRPSWMPQQDYQAFNQNQIGSARQTRYLDAPGGENNQRTVNPDTQNNETGEADVETE